MTLLEDSRSEPVASAPARPYTEASTARVPFEGRRGWLAALVVAIFSWDSGITRIPVASIDDSWRYMLQTAAADGLDFGVDTAFTYGPLVHLDGGPMYSRLGGLATVLVALVLSWAAALLVIRRCSVLGFRRWSTLLIALVLTIVVIPPLRYSEAVALVACGWLLAEIVDRKSTATVRYSVAVLAGLWVVVKPSAAIVIAGAVAGAAFASGFEASSSLRPDRHSLRTALARAGAVTGLTVLAAVVCWVGTGQRLGYFDDYLHGAREIASGYAEGMAVAPSNPRLEIAFLVAGLMLIGYLARRVLSDRDLRSIFVFLLVLVALFWVRQIAFARPGWSHLKDAGVALALFGVALWPMLGRRVGAAVVAGSTIMTAAVLVPAPYYQVGTFRSAGPIDAALAVAELINIDHEIEQGWGPLALQLTPAEPMAGALQGQRVMYWPYLGSGAFVNQTDQWFPPAVQAYASFTNHLEQLGADALVADDGPDVILHRYDYAIDGHRPAWESPRMQVAIFCSFDFVDYDRTFALLTRADKQCEPAEVLEADVPVIDRRAPIPSDAASCPGIVTFRLYGAETSSLDSIKHLFVRPDPLRITIDGEWRFIPATAVQPHVIASPPGQIWLGGAVPTPDRLPPEMLFNDSFDERGPLTADFECWTTTSTSE